MLFALVLYGPQVPTTGYHLTADFPLSDPKPIAKVASLEDMAVMVLDVVATKPRAGWPVAKGPVSPSDVRYVTADAFSGHPQMLIVLYVNGSEIGRTLLSLADLKAAASGTPEINMAALDLGMFE